MLASVMSYLMLINYYYKVSGHGRNEDNIILLFMLLPFLGFSVILKFISFIFIFYRLRSALIRIIYIIVFLIILRV